MLTDEQIRKAAMDQLDRPMDKILRIVDDNPTLAEQRYRIGFGERCLWGASIIMAAIGVEEAHQSSDPVAVSWWMLFDMIEHGRTTWPQDTLADFDAGRAMRRQAIWDEVRTKLAEQGRPFAGKPYAADVQASTDRPPIQRYPFDVRYAAEKGWLAIRDPFTGEWHEVQAKEVPFTWRAVAKDNWLREKASRGE